jgi:hypothetical protein
VIGPGRRAERRAAPVLFSGSARTAILGTRAVHRVPASRLRPSIRTPVSRLNGRKGLLERLFSDQAGAFDGLSDSEMY